MWILQKFRVSKTKFVAAAFAELLFVIGFANGVSASSLTLEETGALRQLTLRSLYEVCTAGDSRECDRFLSLEYAAVTEEVFANYWSMAWSGGYRNRCREVTTTKQLLDLLLQYYPHQPTLHDAPAYEGMAVFIIDYMTCY